MASASIDFTALQNALGITFKDTALLQQALVHRSYLNETPGFSLPSNERLEFLGDALLGFVVAEELYQQFPDLAEGELTKLRANLVRKETLASLAQTLSLGDYLYLGQGEERSGGRRRGSNLSHVVEAVIGAVLIDQGFAVAKDFVLRLINKVPEKMVAEELIGDHKSRLQELVQAERRMLPAYRVVASEGPPHDKVFTVEVVVDNEVLGRGSGKGKRTAEQEAARSALEHWEK